MVTRPLRPERLTALVLLNLLVLCACLHMTVWSPAADKDRKLQAVHTAMRAQQTVGSRLTGEEYTPLTTTLGAPEAKKLSQHPDFAAVAVELLEEAGIQAGDRVAVNMSGSFPALNIAVLSALQAMGAEPVITSSVGASTWGANRPEYTWLDMEASLAGAGLWPWRSRAAGIGGVGDQGGGLTPEGVELARQAIQRSGVPAIAAGTLTEAIARRLEIYRGPDGQLPGALVNVGGSHVVFGEQGHHVYLRQGLLSGYQSAITATDGLAAAFLNANRPVVHFLNIGRMAAEYGISPGREPGTSRVFSVRTLPPAARLLITIWLSAVFLCLWYGQKREWWQGPCR